MKRLIIALTCVTTIGLASAAADTLALDKLDRDIDGYLQKILSNADAACFEHIITKIIAKEDRKEYYLTFEDTNQTSAVEIGSYDSSYLYTCVGGKLLSWDTGESTVLEDFTSAQ